MSSILPKPIFDENTCFHKISPSHKALEAQWIIDTVNPNKILSIVSSGHDGIELAKLDDDTHIYLPTVTPRKIVEKSKKSRKEIKQSIDVVVKKESKKIKVKKQKKAKVRTKDI